MKKNLICGTFSDYRNSIRSSVKNYFIYFLEMNRIFFPLYYPFVWNKNFDGISVHFEIHWSIQSHPINLKSFESKEIGFHWEIDI
jgi:hypothetical protein